MRELVQELFGWAEGNSIKERVDGRIEVGSAGAMDLQRASEMMAYAVHRVHRGEWVLQHELHRPRVVPPPLLAELHLLSAEQKLSSRRDDDAGEHPS